MKKKFKKFIIPFVIIAAIVLGMSLFPAKKINDGQVSAAENFKFKFLKDNLQTVEISDGSKTVSMKSESSDGTYETNGDETVYKHADGRKEDRYVKTLGRMKHYTYYYSIPAGCNGTCHESETYTFENAVLHKNSAGGIELFYTKNKDTNNLYENGGTDKFFIIQIPIATDKNRNNINVDYKISGENHNQLIFSFNAIPDLYPLTLDPTLGSEGDISNESPVFTVTVSDNGSSSAARTNVGSAVTFTATAKDINTDQYYLAICKTNSVTVGNDTAPTCAASSTWAISSATNSDSQATAIYTAQSGDVGSNTWYGFVCDKLPTASGPACFPATSAGDQGLAIGTVAFSNLPADTDYITVDGIAYEFDTNSSVTGGRTAVDISSALSGSDVAAALVTAESGISSHMTSRASVVYVYADSAGTIGNSIGMAENQDTNSAITISGTNLTGGSDNNASPFYVTQPGTFGTVTVTNASNSSTIVPGDTLKFKLAQGTITADGNINMYICSSATTAFNYSTNSCTGGTLVCSATNVNPTNADAMCQESGNNLVPIPTSHGSKTFKVYVEDSRDLPATGTNSQNYTVTDVPPTLVSYTATDTPVVPAGGSDTVDFSAVISDNNGDSDVTAVEGILFDDTPIDLSSGTCPGGVTNEQNCYIVPTCSIVTGTADAQLTANCQATIWFNANASSNWEVHVNPTDGLGKVTNLANTDVNITNPALQAVGVVEGSIAYGSLSVGSSSSGQSITISNAGNQISDLLVSGSDMCTDYPTCSGDKILKQQQKWTQTDGVNFNWTTQGHVLISTPGSGDADTNGCANIDLAVPTNHTSSASNENIFWKLQIANGQKTGVFTGSDTIQSTASASCTGTP